MKHTIMQRSHPLFYRASLLLLAAFSCVTAQAASVELQARSANTGAPVYVKAGVPFANGQLRSAKTLQLRAADGRPTAAQFDVLARWPDKSVKSVLVSTMLKPSSGSQTLSLNYGSDIESASSRNGIKVNDAGGKISVDTGLIKFVVDKQRFTVLDGVWRDLNNDGQYSANEQQLGKGDVYLVDASTDETYQASRDSKPKVSIEEQGSVRVVIKAEGKMLNKSARELTDFQVRIYAYAGAEQIDIEYALIDRRDDVAARKIPDQLPLSLKEYGLRFEHRINNADFYFGGDKNKVHVGKISGEHHIMQTGKMHFVDGDIRENDPFALAYSGAGKGRRASGWMAIGNEQSSVGAMVQDFWQEFPNELAVTPDALLIRLHPERALGGKADTHQVKQVTETKTYTRPNTLYSPRVGMAKTSTIRLTFHPGKIPAKAIVANNRHFQKHAPLMRAKPSWYAKSGVFGNISPTNKDTKRYDNYLMSNIYEISFKEGKIPILYGWRDFGDRLYHGWITEENGVRIPGFYNDAHVGSNVFFKQYLRTADPRWWHTAEIATQHFIDIDVSNGRRFGRHGFNGGKIWTPPGEPMLISHGNNDHSSRGIHLGHAHVSGMTDFYLLTGDKRTKDAIDLTAAWWKFVIPKFFPTPRPVDPDKRAWAEAERDFAWPLYTANEYVRVNGDPTFHREVAGQVVRHLIDWWKTPSKHEINGEDLGRNDASRGTGWWAMDEMDNGDGTGTNPWMAGALFSALIQFYQHDLLMPSGIDHGELKDMMWQCMNYVVKNGWHAEKEHFAYSEARKEENGGAEHVLYGLAYLYQLLEADKKAGLVAHPEWYDTSDSWYKIARKLSKRFTSNYVGGQQDFGFYGYEMVYPVDFFNVMAEIEGRKPKVSQSPPGPIRLRQSAMR